MPNINNKQRFIMLHSADDNSVFGMNVDGIVLFSASEENGHKCTTIFFDNESSDITSCTVNETCEKIVKMLDLTLVPTVLLHSCDDNSVVVVVTNYLQMFGCIGKCENSGTELFLTVPTDAEQVVVNESPEKVFKMIKDKLSPDANGQRAM